MCIYTGKNLDLSLSGQTEPTNQDRVDKPSYPLTLSLKT